jgi:hypothetical protein
MKMMERGMGGHHSGAEKRETDGRKAERIVQEELEKRGWSEEDLAARRKTDADKTAIAARLRSQTVMMLDWIAKRLKMGCRHTAANCLKIITKSRDPSDGRILTKRFYRTGPEGKTIRLVNDNSAYSPIAALEEDFEWTYPVAHFQGNS